MNAPLFLINLHLAWLWLLLGFITGMVLGMFFHDEKWLGGYASHKRRMYRLGHISFFGLGTVNLMFYFTAQQFGVGSSVLALASGALVVGAITMPICCAVMAHRPKAHLVFTVPVLSLIAGGALTLAAVCQTPPARVPPPLNHQLSTLTQP